MKIYTFKVTYDDVDDLERIIELPADVKLAQLAYTILVTFNTALNHLYEISYKGKKYDCGIMTDEFLMPGQEILLATNVNVSTLDMKISDTFELKYDFGCDQLFNIEVINIEERKDAKLSSYPKVISGKGKGIIDDVHVSEFKEIVRRNNLYYTERKWPFDEDDDFPYVDFLDFKFEQYSQTKNDRFLRKLVKSAMLTYEHDTPTDQEYLAKWYGVFYSVYYGLSEYEYIYPDNNSIN